MCAAVYYWTIPETIEFVQLVSRVAWPGPDLPGGRRQLGAAPGTVEVIGMVHLATETERVTVDDGAGTCEACVRGGAIFKVSFFGNLNFGAVSFLF